MKKWLSAALALLSCLLGPSAWAGDHFVVRASRETIEEVCETHGLRLIRELGRAGLFLVAAPDGVSADELKSSLTADLRVADFEREAGAKTPRVALDAQLSQSTVAILAGLDRTPMDFFGGSAWTGYVEQPAATFIGADRAHADQQTGNGVIVAVIDTGVDENHSLLKDSLVQGYDFTRDVPGVGSEWADLNQFQSTVAILNRYQSTVAILNLFQSTVAILNQSTVAILAADSAPAILDLSADPLPASFGHGTMVAGLIRVVAPQAWIMPLKAFRADGSGRVSDIVRAIYYAADNGANVINMSFDLDRASDAVRRAIQYATNRGVICVGSAGNEGREAVVYPAALRRVIGVASTTLEDARALFSNYGERLVEVAAPGEDLITAYPGGHYAAASGTSFSAGLVSGAAAILAGLKLNLNHKEASDAFENSVFISPELGNGRIDIPAAVRGLDLSVAERDRE